MVRKLELDSLTAEAASLEAMLHSRSTQEDPIGHLQYADKLAEVRERIGELEGSQDLSASVALFFAGEPVVGSYGMKADFAGRAVELFQDIVSKRFAANEFGDLGRRGPVPLRANSDLLLTNIARGSFGVILEEAGDMQPLAETQLKVVVDDVLSSMKAAATEDAAEFEQLLETIDGRYLRALGDFFQLLDDQSATVRVVEGKEDQQLSPEQIHRARERTSAATIEDRDGEMLVGRLFLLPSQRRFELKTDSGEVVWGPVSREFATTHLEELQAQANEVVGRRWRVLTRARTVTRPNRAPKTTYRLVKLVERLD